ncbi:MAG: hypothetical protein ACM31L_05355 [Actinomycetota bacterium]
MASLLATLYACSGVAGAVCYGPQLVHLWRVPEARRAMSPLTWGGWAAMGAVALAYAAFEVRAAEMVAVTAANWTCQCLVLAMALGQRLADRKTKRPRLWGGAVRTVAGEDHFSK